jgi:Uma2 family endonuclease
MQQIALSQLVVMPGHQLKIEDVSWEMYERISAEVDRERKTRINYSQGILEIMAPSAEHEDDKAIIGDLVKLILEELDIEFRSLASTTFKNKEMQVALEADDCFYIKNEALVRGKTRIDLEKDPPPELAIEIDISSRTRFNNYEALGVKELWRFDGKKLQINILENGKYIESQTSPSLNGWELVEVIPQYLEMSKTLGRNATIKRFRVWVLAQMTSQER